MSDSQTVKLADLEFLIGPRSNYRRIHEWEKGNFRLTSTHKELIKEWLIALGVPERKVILMEDAGLNNAYGAGQQWAERLKNEDSERRFGKPKRGQRSLEIDIDLDAEPPKPGLVDLLNLEGPRTQPEAVTPSPEASPASDLHITEAIKRALEAVISPRLNAISANLTAQLDRGMKAAERRIPELALAAAKQAIQDLAPRKLEIDLRTQAGALSLDLGLQHHKFETLLRAVSARDHRGNHLNIWLTGPTGSGKTTATENVARALESTFSGYTRLDGGKWQIANQDGESVDLNGLAHDGPFGADSSLDADYKIVGFKDANGKFHWTTFLRIFAFGGIYVADEIDNWYPSALVAINAALANGWISTPIGLIRRHKDCCIIAAANTWGLGATNDYVGRTKLDAATINRFPTKIDWPIDETLETAIASQMGGSVGLAWCNLVQEARKAAKAQGLQIILSPRNTIDGISLLLAGFSTSEVLDINLFAGLTIEQRGAIEPVTQRLAA